MIGRIAWPRALRYLRVESMEQSRSSATQQASTRTKAERRPDRALVGTYYEARLADLLEQVRTAFARYDAGELDAFELDDLTHGYKRATRELWKFCGNLTGSGMHLVARTIEDWQARSETIDWWERGNPSRDRE